jgi:hypothetical protein
VSECAWPRRAREAAIELSTGEALEDDSLTARLLRDVQAVFESSGLDRFKTSDLIDELSKIEESPWGDWYGKTLTPQALSRLLRPYRIKTMTIRDARRTNAHDDGRPVKGYKREQFAEAFLRVSGVTRVTRVTTGSAPDAGCNSCDPCNPQGAWEERRARALPRAGDRHCEACETPATCDEKGCTELERLAAEYR